MESFNFAASREILIFSPACKTGKMSILRWIIPKKLGKFCQDNDSSEKEGEVERFDYYWRVPISHFAQKVCYVALSLFATAVFQVNLNIKVLLHFFWSSQNMSSNLIILEGFTYIKLKISISVGCFKTDQILMQGA